MNNRTMMVTDLDMCREKSLPVVKVFCWNCQSLMPRLKIHSVCYFSIVDFSSIQFSSVAQSCPTLCDPVDCSTLGLPVHHQFLEFTQTHVHWVSDTIQPSHPLRPLLLLPSVFPSVRIFLNESALHIRWPKYWSFSFNISPSNEHSGLTSFRMDLGMNIQQQSRS